MLKNLLLFIGATFIFTVGHSQQKPTLEITGTIIESDTKNPVPYVHIVNKALGKGTVSNTEGRFWITMERSDTILFSAIGFEPYAFTVKDEVTSNKLEITIELNTSTMELQPVKIFAYRDEHALKKAMIAMNVPIEKDRSRIELPGFYYGPKKEVTPSAVWNPISFLHSKFSREIKEQHKLAGFQQQENFEQQVKAKYNEHVVIALTGLPEDHVDEFMEFCKLPESFIGRSSEYEIAVAVTRCLSEFLAVGED